MAGTPTFRKAGKTRNQVRIEYTDRKGRNIVRTVRPYEIKNGKLWATDTRHGAGHIHSFTLSRVRSATPLENTFKPRWPVKV